MENRAKWFRCLFSFAHGGKNLPSSLLVFLNDFFWLFCCSLWLADWRQLSFFIFLLNSVITGCSLGCILSTEPCILPRSLATLWLMLLAMAILWWVWWLCGHCELTVLSYLLTVENWQTELVTAVSVGWAGRVRWQTGDKTIWSVCSLVCGEHNTTDN